MMAVKLVEKLAEKLAEKPRSWPFG